jgi:hypothetical protein
VRNREHLLRFEKAIVNEVHENNGTLLLEPYGGTDRDLSVSRDGNYTSYQALDHGSPNRGPPGCTMRPAA